jgi:hypothetical protein
VQGVLAHHIMLRVGVLESRAEKQPMGSGDGRLMGYLMQPLSRQPCSLQCFACRRTCSAVSKNLYPNTIGLEVVEKWISHVTLTLELLAAEKRTKPNQNNPFRASYTSIFSSTHFRLVDRRLQPSSHASSWTRPAILGHQTSATANHGLR